MTCPECGGPVEDDTLYLAIPAIGSPAQAYCSPRCGDLYGTELYLATDRRAWATIRRRCDFLDKQAPQSAGFAQFATWHPKDGGLTANIVVLWVDVKAHRTTLDLIDTAAHEAAHAVAHICEYIGHDVKGTDEPSAYLVGWLTRWMLDGLLPDTTD